MSVASTRLTNVSDLAGSTNGYVHGEVLVTTGWVAEHLTDPAVRIIESNEDPLLFENGHIPGAVKLDWQAELQNPVNRDFVDKAGFERLMSRKGIATDSIVVFYGDRNNWYAAYTFWLFKYFGHADCRIMNGGRTKWEAEGRPYASDLASYAPTRYVAREPSSAIRAFRGDVLVKVATNGGELLDVRSPQEYSGELFHMPGYPQEGAQRAGHIKGARNITWARAMNEDGTFKTATELRALYEGEGFTPDKDIIAYCRIGERSSHTWFVLTYLLGYPNVRNYDGSWTEWGSMVNVPNERSV
jgi:thiosulfate/3-mercaptopyruvate sulfurtransferase